jgi:hypothetical protein
MITNRKSQVFRPINDASRNGLSVAGCLAMIALLAVVIALFLPAVRFSGEAAHRSQCKNSLKQIGLALHRYEADYGVLPPAFTVDADGQPLHSWRTLILPYLDEESLYQTIDLSKPWDDPVNKKARDTRVTMYLCPSVETTNPSETTYLAIVSHDSCFGRVEGRPLSDVTSDHDQTIMVIDAGHEWAVHWMAPTDIDERFLDHLKDEDAFQHVGGLQATLVDGSVRFFYADMDRDKWHELLSRN